MMAALLDCMPSLTSLLISYTSLLTLPCFTVAQICILITTAPSSSLSPLPTQYRWSHTCACWIPTTKKQLEVAAPQHTLILTCIYLWLALSRLALPGACPPSPQSLTHCCSCRRCHTELELAHGDHWHHMLRTTTEQQLCPLWPKQQELSQMSASLHFSVLIPTFF